MTLTGLWSIAVRTYAVLGIAFAPVFAFGSYFVARNTLELLFAVGQLLMIVPLWRMYLHRRWAGLLVCYIGLIVCGYWLLHFKESTLPLMYSTFAIALFPALLVTTGKRSWLRGF